MAHIRYHLLLYMVLFSTGCFAQGLKFHSGEKPINERTSFSVFNKLSPSFSERLYIEFDMRLYPVSEIGYILRIKNSKGNQIYNLFFDGRGDNFFKLNEEGKYTLITAKIDLPELISKRWFSMALDFNLKKDSISFFIDGKEVGKCQAIMPDTFNPEIVFGRSDYIIDVPTFSMKDLQIGSSERLYFPLSECSGNDVHNINGVSIGHVLNPDWLINDFYHWKKIGSFKSATVAGVNYNPARDEIYYFNRDSINIINVTTGRESCMAFGKRCPVDLTLGMNFMDEDNDKLYSYEVYYDDHVTDASVASLNLNSYQWEEESHDHMEYQLHHHSCHFDPGLGRFTIFGGFGNMRYGKEFISYSLADREWNTESEFSGDPLFPRYFSSMGYNQADSCIYVFGGMGNESGEQAVGRRYFYDLYKIDLKQKHIVKLWETEWPGMNAVPVRGMIIPDGERFYTLCYPESISESHLNLYEFSLADGSMRELGDSIPIHSDKIATNANLYYDRENCELYATIQEFDDDISSRLTVYSLAFPPITEKELVNFSENTSRSLFWIIGTSVLFILIVGGVIYRFKYFHRKKQIESITKTGGTVKIDPPKPNSILLFGDLIVRNKENRNISYMFTGKQEQILMVLLRHNPDGGITSRSLSAMLWPDRPESQTKNLRGVTINHLRKTLQEFKGVELVYRDNRFFLEYDSSFYCDYLRCAEITSSKHISDEDKEELLRIVLRGKFIQFSTIPMYDSFKEDMDSKLEPILQIEMEKCFEKGELNKVLSFSDALFNIDSINENALTYSMKVLKRLKLDDQAYIRYQSFISEYKKMMGDDYPTSFKSLY